MISVHAAAPPAFGRTWPPLFAVRRYRLVAVVLLLVWPISACFYWRPLPAPEKGFGYARHVWVRTPQGRQLVVWYPQMAGDSLFGTSSAARKDTQDIRLGNLGALQMRHSEAGPVILVGVGIAAVLGAIAAMEAYVGRGIIH